MDNKISNKSKSSSKPTDKTIKKQKPDDEYITFEEDRKPKNIYEDETELMDESEEYEINNSIQKINGNNSLYDSNNEELEIEKNDSNRYLEVEEECSSYEENNVEATLNETENNKKSKSDHEEASSDEELEIDKSTSDEQTKVNEVNSDDKFKNNEETNVSDSSDEETEDSDDSDDDTEELDEIIDTKFKVENFSISVKGVKTKEDMAELFQGCKILYHDDFPRKELMFVYFEDKKSLKKALKKNGTVFNCRVIVLERLIKSSTKLTVDVGGLHPLAKVECTFNDCEIEYCKRDLRDKSKAVVHFKNEDSVTKALSKNETTITNCVLTVKKYEEPEIIQQTCVQILGYEPNTNENDIFNDCNIESSINLILGETEAGIKFITFADTESFEKALLKNGTTHDGFKITVIRSDWLVELEGIIPLSKLEDVFNDCKIKSYAFINPEFGCDSGKILFFFEDIESVKKALMKNRTEYCGHLILVQQKAKSKKATPKFIPEKQYNLPQTTVQKSSATENQSNLSEASFNSKPDILKQPFEKSFSTKELEDLEQNKLLLKQIKLEILTLEKEIFEDEKSLKEEMAEMNSLNGNNV